MNNSWLCTLLVALAGVFVCEGQIAGGYSVFGWKPKCPTIPTRLGLKPGRANKARGVCEVLGWRRDTCDGPMMACCENVVGDYLCIRPNAVEKKREGLLKNLVNLFGLSERQMPTFYGWRKFLNNNMWGKRKNPANKAVNDKKQENAEELTADEDEKEDINNVNEETVVTNMEADPETEADNGKSGAADASKAADDQTTPEKSGEQVKEEPEIKEKKDDEGVKDDLKTADEDKETNPETKGQGEEVDVDSKDSKKAKTESKPVAPEVPDTDLPTDGSSKADPEGQSANAVVEGAKAKVDEVPEGCPKATYVCDDEGNNCAVACPGYVNVDTCETQDDCPTNTGTICCPDPCPGSGIKLCLAPVITADEPASTETATKTEKAADVKIVVGDSKSTPAEAKTTAEKTTTKKPVDTSSATTATTPTLKKEDAVTAAAKVAAKKVKKVESANAKVEAIKTPEKPNAKGLDDGGVNEFVCPKGDFTSCIGWSEVPGKKGTGTCKSDSECAKDRLCCKISECGDDVKYCVPYFETAKLKPGCPIPQWTAVLDAKPCTSPCPEGKICCAVDMQGNESCVSPTSTV